jgi:hypothetical protein
MVLKEKKIFGNVIGGPYHRIKKSFFEKLSAEQRDAIRSVVNQNFILLGLSINDFTPNFDFSYSPFSHVTQFMR